MRNFFFPKLAFQNIGKNKRFYIPYLITCVFTITMFYDLLFIAGNEGISKIHGADALTPMLGLGCWIVGIFSAIFLFYTNSFLIKHRKKEIGLYNILGMSKSNIAHLLIWETLITAVITMIIGILCGILISKLMLLLLCNILSFDIQLGFSVSLVSVETTLIVFAAIFLVTLIYNLACIKISKPVELLKGENVGEKEPKAKWIIASLGVLALGVAYYIALTTKDPIAAIPLFFISVLLVIFGTYTLFISGSIAFLKILRNKKNYYYKTNHFTSISGMIYRMKQNAAGLASICILSTMVLVMVSGTVCLNLGSEDIINRRSPYDMSFTSDLEAEPKTDKAGFMNVIEETVSESGYRVEERLDFEYLEVVTVRNENSFKFYDGGNESFCKSCYVVAVTVDQYNILTGKEASLSENEMLAFFYNDKLDCNKIKINNKDYNVTWVKKFPVSEKLAAYANDVICIVLNNESFNELNNAQRKAYAGNASHIEWDVSYNLNCDDENQQLELFNEASERIEKNTEFNYRSSCKADLRQSFYSLYGGLFFIGIFLGTLFLGFTTLIIYYKQISEGYDDKQRFEIMQKVGMSKAEVKRSINSQVLKVFFLPLIMAVVHLAFAFRIISQLLLLLGIFNTVLFIYCTIGTVIAFALIYFLIYYFTAKTYYKIVNS